MLDSDFLYYVKVTLLILRLNLASHQHKKILLLINTNSYTSSLFIQERDRKVDVFSIPTERGFLNQVCT